MTSNAENFKNLMSDLLLADPITTNGKGTLTSLKINITEEEYLKELYVEPFTLYQRESDEKSDPMIDLDCSRRYIWRVRLNALKDAQTSFENR